MPSSSGDNKQSASRLYETRNLGHCLLPESHWQNLECVRFKDEIESASPVLGRLEQIRDHIVNRSPRESALAPGNGCRRYVESRCVKSPTCQFLGIITQSAAYLEGFLPTPHDPVVVKPSHQMGVRHQICPWYDRGITVDLGIEFFESPKASPLDRYRFAISRAVALLDSSILLLLPIATAHRRALGIG